MASEQEIIDALEEAASAEVKIRILDQLGQKIKPQHRDLISHLVILSRKETNQDVAYSVKRALFRIRSRYNITNFPLFLMDPVRLLQSSDPACRVKALEVFDKGEVNVEQCYHFLGALFFEDDPFVLSKMMKIVPVLSRFIPARKIEKIMENFLDSKDSRVRANALDSLGLIRETGDEEGFLKVWACLKDPDQRVRANAIAQILENPPGNLRDHIQQRVESSEDYYELLGITTLIKDARQEVDAKLQSRMDKKIHDLERKLPMEEESSVEEIGMERKEKSAGVNFSMISYMFGSQKGVWTLAVLVILALFAYRTQQQNHQLREWNSQLTQSGKNYALKVSELNKKLKADDPEVPIALRQISSKEKLNRFQEEGSSLRQNADLFMKRAKELFEEERYSEASTLFRSLYEVYKDNRLAVDSVRWLSKTQKIENILRSVNEYLKKGQFISCRRKLEELRHLVSSEVYEGHLRRIESVKNSKEAKQ